MPQWAHLPLILKPDGNGKLSKRDGDRLGFPVYAMNWHDPKTGDTTIGFREKGFLPEAFINILALLGWNSGTDKEIFSITELIEAFSMERVNHAGAKFDYEKAKWFNQQYLAVAPVERLLPFVQADLKEKGIYRSDKWVSTFIGLMKDRVVLLPDFVEKGSYFFDIQQYDLDQIKKRWSADKKVLLTKLLNVYENTPFDAAVLEQETKAFMTQESVKPGDLLPLLRLSLAGTMQGPAVFDMMQLLAKEETMQRFHKSMAFFDATIA
jgi:glutamyl-tRNA synthetase